MHRADVAAAGPGGGPHIQVFDGRTRDTNSANEGRSFYAYDPRFAGGVYVAVGNVDTSDGAAEIVTGTGLGGDYCKPNLGELLSYVVRLEPWSD